MAQINHNISFPNDGLGDPLRTAFGNQNAMNTELYSTVVFKETGKGLSSNDYTTLEKAKLAGIAAGAEVNVQANWNQQDTTADDYIKGKPSNGGIVTYGTYSKTGQNLTINPGWVWKINDVLYSNTVAIVINFPFSATGLQRLDLVVFNQSNSAQRVQGDESVSAPSTPFIPENTILFSISLITDSNAGEPVTPTPMVYAPELFTSSGSNNFTLMQTGMIAVSVFIDRGMRYKTSEWTQSGQVITLIGTASTGKKIYITP